MTKEFVEAEDDRTSTVARSRRAGWTILEAMARRFERRLVEAGGVMLPIDQEKDRLLDVAAIANTRTGTAAVCPGVT